MPSASFILKYGRVLNQGSLSWQTQSKLAIAGWYVKVEHDCADGTITWVGFIDQIADEQGGMAVGVPTGTQKFVALSMAQLLAYEYMTRSKWHDERVDEIRWSGGAISFNQEGKPNRSDSDSPAGADSPLFAPRAPKNWDGEPFIAPKFWSSRDIANYLINYAVPLDSSEEKKVKFRLDNVAAIPDWDRPVIDTEGKSVLAILEELINPSKLLQLSVTHDESTSPHSVVLRVNSLSHTELSLPDSKTHPANTNTCQIIAAASHDTNVVVQGSISSIVNQVVVRGAKRETMYTGAISTADTFLLPGWNTTELSEYNNAASAEAGYSAASTSQKRHMNQVVRGRHKLNDVFKTFVLNPSYLLDGADILFRDEDGERYIPWWNDVTVSPTLPLKEGLAYDEAGITTAKHEATVELRTPFVVFQRPGSSPASYLQAEKMADGTDPIFACQVGLAKDNAGITLDVLGHHQHAIAHDTFVPLPVDDTERLGEWDYSACWVTVSLNEDRFAEYKFPPDDSVSSASDAIRKKVFYAGDGYKRTAVVFGAFVEIDTDGSLKSIDVSNLQGSSPNYTLVDDTDKLEAIGKIAASWYLVPRQIVRLISSRPSAEIAVGQLVTTINSGTPHSATINTVITEIRLSTPLDAELSPASFSVTTAMGELDPLQFLPPPPKERASQALR